MKDTVLNNPAYEKPIEVDINLMGDTGEIIYCNGYGNLEKIDRLDPKLKSRLENTNILQGSTILMQLKNFFKLEPGGPWYIDLVNGTIFIHNRNWSDPVIQDYTYYQEHGEVLKVTFSLQAKYQGKNREVSLSKYNPLDKLVEKLKVEDPGPMEVGSGNNLDNSNNQNDPDKINPLGIRHIELNDATTVYNDAKAHPEIYALESRNKLIESQREKAERIARVENLKKYSKNVAVPDYNKAANALSTKTRTTAAANDFVDDNGGSREALLKLYDAAYTKYTQANGPRTNYDPEGMLRRWDRVRYQVARNVQTGKTKAQDAQKEAEKLFYQYVPIMNPKYTSNIVFKGKPKTTKSRTTIKLTNKQCQEYLKLDDPVSQNEYLKKIARDQGYEFDPTASGQEVKGSGWNGNRYMFNNGLVMDRAGMYGYIGRLSVYANIPTSVNVSHKQIFDAAWNKDETGELLSQLAYQEARQDALESRISALENTYKRRREKELTADMDVVGRPSLIAARYINLWNVGSKWSGKWYIKQCTHSFDTNQGYITNLKMVKR